MACEKLADKSDEELKKIRAQVERTNSQLLDAIGE
jgi:hypothetical protein